MSLPNLKIGIAGYGSFGNFLHKAWSRLEGVQVVAVSTLQGNPEGLRVYDHWEGLVTDAEVDLVAIATPPNLHAPIAEAMMQAGKHVLIEKPVATALADARRLLEVRNRTQRVASVNFMMRFTPVAEVLAGWKQDAPFGRLRRVVIENHAQDGSLPPQHWFWDPAQSGGIMVEHAVHFFDLIASLTDEQPVRVDGWSHHRSQLIEDRVMASVYYNEGLAATQYHTFSRPDFFERTTIRLWYDLAEVEMQEWFPLNGTIRALTNASTEPALAMLPNFVETSRTPVPGRTGSVPHKIHVSGQQFPVSDQICGTFHVSQPKQEVYADAVCALLNDIRRAIGDPNHALRVPLECGVQALQLALQAGHGRTHPHEAEQPISDLSAPT